MRTCARAIASAFAAGACLAPFGAQAYDSGGTGADGAFNPTVNVTYPLPASGILHFTTVNIPAGVTVRFVRNATNTPVQILTSGDVIIDGTIDVSGASAPSVGAAGDGQTGDDGVNGLGGPGGFDGGRGGIGASHPYDPGAPTPRNYGGAGLGPGAGSGGFTGFHCNTWSYTRGGTGGAFVLASEGITAGMPCSLSGVAVPEVRGGTSYGTDSLLPLLGGSGGGGGGGGKSGAGAGGGGGGGALLIASSGTVRLNGSILANGGAGGSTHTGAVDCSNVLNGPVWGAPGGGGSGGAVRIVATAITGTGAISAAAGSAGGVSGQCVHVAPTAASPGRIRLEGETNTHTGSRIGSFTAGAPAPAFVAGTPGLRIASVAGVSAPATPTGSADITLPASTPNPVTVVVSSSGVPVGNTVQVTVTPAYGERTSAITPALSGSTASASASVAVNLPTGPSVLSAQTTYTVVAAVGDLLRNYAGNERVEKVTLMATLGGPSRAKLITVSGKEYEVPAEVLRIAGLGS